MAFYEQLQTYCDPIFESYAPYTKLEAFWEGLEDEGYRNPYDGKPRQGLAAQDGIVVGKRGCDAIGQWRRSGTSRNASKK